jgi:DNA-binding transcriptional MerR regulator
MTTDLHGGIMKGIRQQAAERGLTTVLGVARRFGVPQSTLVYWVYTGFVPKPSVLVGKQMYYSREDAEMIGKIIQGMKGGQ